MAQAEPATITTAPIFLNMVARIHLSLIIRGPFVRAERGGLAPLAVLPETDRPGAVVILEPAEVLARANRRFMLVMDASAAVAVPCALAAATALGRRVIPQSAPA